MPGGDPLPTLGMPRTPFTLGKSDAISVTAEWIFSEQGTKLGGSKEG